MSRAVILPSLGDPLLLNLWIKSYTKYVQQYVDTIYIRLTSGIDENVRNFIVHKFKEICPEVYLLGYCEQHGNNIRFLLEQCKEDYICLLEDDVFILKDNVLNDIFIQVEDHTFDCIGSTRGCCSAEVVSTMKKKFDLSGSSPEHAIADCPNFWPSLFFCHKNILLNTDRDFNARCWSKGDTIPIIDHLCTKDECGDTFVWTSIQLRNMKYKFGYIHQYHAGPIDIIETHSHKGLFKSTGVPWVHFGSLSSGICGLLQYETGAPLMCGSEKGGQSFYPELHPTLVDELSRRLAVFKIVSEYGKLEDTSLDYFNTIYINAVERAIKYINLPQDKVDEFYKCYKQLLSPILE